MAAPRQGKRYTTKEGDTLQRIAIAVYGNAGKWSLLRKAFGTNFDLSRQTRIPTGLTIFIPADPTLNSIKKIQRK